MVRTGFILSGIGHIGLILWVLLAGLFVPRDRAPQIDVQVSVISAAEFAAMEAAAPAATDPAPAQSEPAPEPAPEPEPAPPEPEPTPEPPPPEPDPTPPEPVTEEAPPHPLPVVEAPAPVPTLQSTPRPPPRRVDRIAPVPQEAPPPDTVVSETAPPTPQPTPSETPAPVTPDRPRETAPPEAATRTVTEADRPTTEPEAPQAGSLTASVRPRARPRDLQTQVAAPTPAQPRTPAPDTSAIAAAAAAAAAVAAAMDTPGTGGTGGAASGPPLTGGEIDGLHRAISACWLVGQVSTDTSYSVVRVAVSMRADGTPDAVRLVSADGPTEAGRRSAFETARRAILRCAANGALPRDKYEQWREIEMEFDYTSSRLR